MTEEEQRLHDYLAQYKSPAAWRAWGILCAEVPGLAIPNAGAVAEGHVVLLWERGEDHLELEVPPTGPAAFFYLSGTADWDCNWIIGDPLPVQAVAYLRRFVS